MSTEKLTIIAGPCAAESYEIMRETAHFLVSLLKDYPIEFYFKASFDKANRSSISGYRGPGIDQAIEWFQRIKQEFKVKVLTDIHECWHVQKLESTFDGLQIPAFLCRQTDLVKTATESGLFVNIKKGQFISHDATKHIAQKVKDTAKGKGLEPNFALTERGNVFGYSDLLVDMRGFSKISVYGPAIFDITHSCQKPSSGSTTEGARAYAALLARSAAATGYLSGLFLEMHPEPNKAKSDAATQLSFKQGAALIEQVIPIWQEAKKWREQDSLFE